MPHKEGLRASNKGFLSLNLREYAELLVWTGKQKDGETQGAMPADYVATFTGLGIDPQMWCKLVWGFKSIFGRSRYAAHRIA